MPDDHAPRTTVIDTPLGRLALACRPDAVLEIRFEDDGQSTAPDREPHPLNREVARQLEQYFAGRRKRFELPLAPTGTPFQCRVWHELATIPWGVTVSYGELARRVGRPAASRAVGAANGKNPLPIVLPCHRVIGASGQLTGYGGGLWRKKRLLGLEGALLIEA